MVFVVTADTKAQAEEEEEEGRKEMMLSEDSFFYVFQNWIRRCPITGHYRALFKGSTSWLITVKVSILMALAAIDAFPERESVCVCVCECVWLLAYRPYNEIERYIPILSFCSRRNIKKTELNLRVIVQNVTQLITHLFFLVSFFQILQTLEEFTVLTELCSSQLVFCAKRGRAESLAHCSVGAEAEWRNVEILNW